ncbi:MAG: adenylyltransferase/cytidyltransferase family protein [Crocinitomicaceae bacterium]|nr:adenylyltransferase/cytidyltransferase family protein [Crocinitomicaceae bacterium]
MSRLSYIQNKIVNPEQAARIINIWKMKGDQVVFTNGCFDILHKGHVIYLAKAAELGDRLVIGLNSDTSIQKQNKGIERPINPQEAREVVLAALGFVDLIVIFEADTPIELIESLHPNILVKGADYDPNETDPKHKKYIVGSDFVRKNNGQVAVVDLEAGFSTTSLIQKMKS